MRSRRIDRIDRMTQSWRFRVRKMPLHTQDLNIGTLKLPG
jgi:hypothetical protein